MGRHRKPYPAEIRAQMVELMKAEHTPGNYRTSSSRRGRCVHHNK